MNLEKVSDLLRTVVLILTDLILLVAQVGEMLLLLVEVIRIMDDILYCVFNIL